MQREKETRECKRLLTDESTDHLHIRRKAIVTGFTDDFRSDLEDCKVVSVQIHEWTYDELMETLRGDLQKELSRLKYYYSRLTSTGLTLFGFGANGGAETRPDYMRTTDYLQDVAKKAEDHLVVFIDYNGSRPVEGFGWISKLDIPDDATIVTDGFSKCHLDGSEAVEIGRLSKEQSVDYLTDLRSAIDEEEAAKIHETHDGNPVAIEIANEHGNLREQLTGANLRELWSRVYDDKISGDELDLLTESSHLIDLDQRDVASVTGKTRGEAKEILRQLERKGVVSQKQSGLFTADKYVKHYTAAQLSQQELSKKHRMSFHDYVEKWVEAHELREQEMQNRTEEDGKEDPISPPNFDVGLTDPNLFLAIHHLAGTHNELNRETFIEELEDVDAETSGVFTFGLFAQRFFFEEPLDVIQDLSGSILGIDEDIKNELFSGTLSIFFDFDAQQYVSRLADGWSGDINTDSLGTTNAPQPDEIVKNIQQGIGMDFYQALPQDVKIAIAHLVALAVADSRTARDYYNRFGKTAEKYGLTEAAFCQWLDELNNLIEELNPETETADRTEADRHEETFETLNSEIRDRTELRQYLEENRSQAQRQFQQRLERIRSKPDEIAEQYIRCGEHLAESDNTLFPFLWYAFGHKIFAKAVLRQKHWDIYGEYKEWSGAREEQEKNLDDDDVVVTKDEMEALLEWEA